MPTNLLSLPLLTVTFETATNESWRDSVAFTTAGTITGYATAGNAGNGSLTALSVTSGAYIGDYIVTLMGATTFRVADPDGYTIGAGVVGVPFSASGVAFTLSPGSGSFAAGNSFTLTVLPKPLDITGIRFMATMRRTAQDATIILSADTTLGTMVNGGTSGILGFAVSVETMEHIAPSNAGSPYVLDVVAIADGDQRRCVTGTNAVVPGITLPIN